MSETSETILIIVIVLLTIAQLTMLVLGIAIALYVRKLIKQAVEVVDGSKGFVEDLASQLRKKSPLISLAAWTIKRIHKRRK